MGMAFHVWWMGGERAYAIDTAPQIFSMTITCNPKKKS